MWRTALTSLPRRHTYIVCADEGAWHDSLLPLSPSLDNFLALAAAGSGCGDPRPSLAPGRLPSRLLR